jgi:isocitrate dehydrogenase
MMLVHIGETSAAERVHNAWLRTIEEGVHTYDIYEEGKSKQKVGTKEFAEAVAARLGQIPQTLKAAKYKTVEEVPPAKEAGVARPRSRKDLVGVDIFLDWTKGTADELGDAISKLATDGTTMAIMSNRGVKVWPGGHAETFCSDHWRCRFLSSNNGGAVSHQQVISLLDRIASAGFDFIKIENLYNFDGQPGYSLSQGE